MNTYEEINKEFHDKLSTLLETNKAFWAFSDSQLQEGMDKYGIVNKSELISFRGGMIAPKVNIKAISLGITGLEAKRKQAIKERADIKKIILYELNNYECFYTGDIEDALPALTALDITRDQVMEVFKHPKAK